MKLHQLVSGIASGYATKLIQLAVSLLLVPFFLRESVLGLDGYGRAFTISAVIGFLPLVTEGIGFAFVRNISRALDHPQDGPLSDVLGAGLKILGSACAAAVAATVALSPLVLPLVGLETSQDTVGALAMAGLLYLSDNLSQLVRAPLVARGAITYVNGVGASESLLRALAYLAFFTFGTASLTAYFAIQFVFSALRNVAFVGGLTRRWPGDVRGVWRAPWAIGKASIRESWPMATQVGCEMLVLRIPIVLATRVLGPEATGLLGLAATTIRLFVLQSFYAVLQPIAVPLASRVDPRRLSPLRLELLWRFEAVYVFVSGLLVMGSVVCMPDLIQLWLGDAYGAVALPAQLMLIACAFEMSFNGRASLLIGQGLLGAAIPGILLAAVASLLTSATSIAGAGSWQLGVLGVALFFPASAALGIDTAFRGRLVHGVGTRPRSHPFWFLLAAGAIAWLLSPHAAGQGVALIAARLAATALALVALAHFLLVPIPIALETLRTIRRSLDRSILAEPPGSGSTPTT